MQEGGTDLQALGDLAHAVVEHGIARYPEDPVLLPLPPQREPDHVTDDRAAQRGAVAAGRGGDLDRRSPRRLQSRSGPRLQTASIAAEALRARGSGNDGTCRGQQRPAGGVEIVVVVIVAEQDGIDRSEVRRGHCRPGQLP